MKKIRFALKMKDDVEVRSLEELREAFDLELAMGYLADGKLERWLEDRFYEEEAGQIAGLDKEAPDLSKRLCDILQVPYTEGLGMSLEEVAARKARLKKLQEVTDDDEVLRRVDQVAFDQEELAERLDEGWRTIYLCGEGFRIPERVKGITYIGVGTTLEIDADRLARYKKNGIEMIDLVAVPVQAVQRTEPLGDLSFPDVMFVCEDGEGKRFLAGLKRKDRDISYKDGVAEWHNGFVPEVGRYKRPRWAVMRGKMVIYGADGEIRAWNRQTDEDHRVMADDPGLLGSRFFVSTTAILKADRIRGLASQGTIAHRALVSDRIDREVKISREDYIRAGNGFYSIAMTPEGELRVYELSDRETEERVYSFHIKGQEAQSSSIRGKWADDRSGRIYFLLVNGEAGYLLRYDIAEKKVEIAYKKKLRDFSGLCCIRDEKIFYHYRKGTEVCLMALDMRSERERCLWAGLPDEKVSSMEIVGDHVIFMFMSAVDGRMTPINKVYMVKLDGVGKAIVDTGERTDGPIQIYKKGAQISIVSICGTSDRSPKSSPLLRRMLC